MPGVLFYMDDILIMGNTDEELCINTIAVMKKLSKHNLKIQLSKMRLWEDQIKVLGVIFSGTRKRIDPAKIQAISTFPAIDTLKKTQSFLGMCAFISSFIPHYSTVAQPIFSMLKDQKRKNFRVTQEGLLAFEKIKEYITKETFLYTIDFSRNLYIAVDASNVAIGAFIYQLDHFPKTEQGLKDCLQKYGFEPDQTNIPYLIPGVATGKNCPLSIEYSKKGIIKGDIFNTFTEETMTAKSKRIREQYIIIVRPIYWYSKTFSECQVRAFSIMEKETLALVCTVMANRDIIEACNNCFIITDNSIILWAIKHSKEQFVETLINSRRLV